MTKRLLNAWFIALAVNVGPSWADDAQTVLPAGVQQALNSRFSAYSPSFAQRFGLPLRQAQALAPGLEAVELAFHAGPEPGWIRCSVVLYVSARIAIDDLGPDASSDVLEPERHFFLRPRSDGKNPFELMEINDSAHFLERQARYFQRIAFATADYIPGKSGARTSVGLEAQVMNIFDGLNHVRTKGCMSSRMIAHGQGMQVMLRRKGAPDYARRVGEWSDEHFVRLELPKTLIDEALPALSAVESYMQKVVERHVRDKKNRPR
jgi:hypothetical protein